MGKLDVGADNFNRGLDEKVFLKTDVSGAIIEAIGQLRAPTQTSYKRIETNIRLKAEMQ